MLGPGISPEIVAGLLKQAQGQHGGADHTRHSFPQLAEQIVKTTAQHFLQPLDCCGQDVQLPGFNLLNGARSKVRQLRQLLLRETSGMSLPTNILTDGF